METQFQYIVNLAKQYNTYSNDSAVLYQALSYLPEEIVAEIYKDYGDPEKKFQPVNVLRAEVAREILDCVQINETFVENINEIIRNKDVANLNHLKFEFVKEFFVLQY